MRNARSGALLLLTSVLLAGCARNVLYTELTETQANEVEAALLSAHIDADKSSVAKSKGFSISVSHGDIPRAMAVLNAVGLPRQQLHTLGDVFPKEGFVSSPLEDDRRSARGFVVVRPAELDAGQGARLP